MQWKASSSCEEAFFLRIGFTSSISFTFVARFHNMPQIQRHRIRFSIALSFVLACLPLFNWAAPSKKIGGVSLVSPARKVDSKWVGHVEQINAEWVALLPYALSRAGNPVLRYDHSRQWWGERTEGIQTIIRHAKQKGMHIMLKPMIWVQGSWAGGLDFETEKEWKIWEENYWQYLHKLAVIAHQEEVEMICIGTELKTVSQKRPDFFRKVIKDLRANYCGKLTYAANWDEYESVTFWNELDYIGIDAYFPLSPKLTPKVLELKQAWVTPFKKIRQLSIKHKKQVLFTEFGYRSLNGCAWQQWETEDHPLNSGVNLAAQLNAYSAFFQTFWNEPWFAGMFLWQWYTDHSKAGGKANSDYTPQNKPAAKLIADWFEKQAN